MNNDNTTIKTVLERVDELGGLLNNKLSELQTGQIELRSEVAELRNDIAEFGAGQKKVESKISVLNNDILTVKADLREFDGRLEKLESQQS